MNTSHPYDLVIGLDRSDKKADLHLITTATGQRRSQTIDTAPEALWDWLRPDLAPNRCLAGCPASELPTEIKSACPP